MFLRFFIPKALYSEGSMFRRFYIPKVLYSKASMLRRFYVPNKRWGQANPQDWQVKETAIPEKKLSFLEMAFVLRWPKIRHFHRNG